MLDDLLELLDRDQRHGPRQRGLGGLLQRLIGDDGQPYRDDDRHGRRDRDDDYRDRRSDDRDDDDKDRSRRRPREVDVDLG